MELEKTVNQYNLPDRKDKTERNLLECDKTYRTTRYAGVSVLQELSFFGGTSIRYWM